MLRGSTIEMADELQRRRDAIGASAITLNGAFLERFAPVVETLDGRCAPRPAVVAVLLMISSGVPQMATSQSGRRDVAASYSPFALT
jgi:hypothetical protein